MSRINLIKLTLLLASSLTVMSGATIAASLPTIAKVFAKEPNAALYARLILTIPALFIAIGSPIAGMIVDRLGRKKLMLFSLLLYALSGTSGVWADNLTSILIGRVFLGIAVAGIMTTTSTLIADYFENEERKSFLGRQAAAMSMGGVIFISLGGILADISWRFPFYIYLLSLAIFGLALLVLHEPEKIPQRIQNQTEADKASRKSIFLLYLLIFFAMVAFYMVPVQIPFLLGNTMGVNKTMVGLAIAAATLSGAISSLNYQKLRNRAEVSTIYTISFIFLGAGYGVVALAANFYIVVVGLFVSGFGSGLIIPNTNFRIMDLASASSRGRVLGGLSTFLFLGQFFSPIITQPLISMSGLQSSFGYIGLILIVSSLIYLLFNRKSLQPVNNQSAVSYDK